VVRVCAGARVDKIIVGAACVGGGKAAGVISKDSIQNAVVRPLVLEVGHHFAPCAVEVTHSENRYFPRAYPLAQIPFRSTIKCMVLTS
jgi:hypothetical protein